ncbi:MAG: biotin transporter BioY [Actinomyces bowdenii]|nr:biotin transporter BioY [Actinomyces bowdenii]
MTTKNTSPSSAGALAAQAGARPLSPLRAIAREAALILSGTAAIALIGQLAIPLPFTPVPITLGTFAALAVGVVLGSRRGAAASLLLAALAAAGAPVLAGWTSGVGVTFGYVLGYALIAGIAGRAARLWTSSAEASPLHRTLVAFAVMLVASSIVFVPGVIWLKLATGMSWDSALGLGLVPFLVGDVIKAMAATSLLPFRGRLH